MLSGIEVEVRVEGVAIGLVCAEGCTTSPAPDALLEQIAAARVAPRPDHRAAVRDMLRFGKYKPTGRGKPACEYLIRAADNDAFPRINNLVDALNLVSLTHQLPISLIDLDLAGARAFAIRRGAPGESYVFNAGGQTIDLTDLLLTAVLPEDRGCANPVKDSMSTKLTDASRNVLAVIYGPISLRDATVAAAAQLADLLGLHGNSGSKPGHAVLSAV